MRCRDIVDDKNIDWECEVHRNYQEKNFGCDPSEYMAQKWMFASEEMGIVLEDDDVPSQSFFPFCKELLERYRYDDEISMICGMNNTGISHHIDTSYLFTMKGSIWGWASWKRVIDTWDETYSWLDDPKKLNLIRSQMDARWYNSYIRTAKYHRSTGKAHYESILAASAFLHKRLNIVPRYNMITNIGISKESTHSESDVNTLPKKIRRLFYAQRYEIDFPLIHPQKRVRDFRFEKEMTPSCLEVFWMRIERVWLIIKHRGFRAFWLKVFGRILRRGN